ncbi:MAG: hypothetical protein LiPW41_102 [Parcubacteria group bacterium LiPW_41]|nr:MAG: hypothetical protein LiPW41_102 [Parcubacteria group bacterium LiPW_41]
MNFFDNDENEVILKTGDFVAFYFKPDEYLAAAIQTAEKKMLNFFENSKKQEYFFFNLPISLEEGKRVIEKRIGFTLDSLEGEEKKHKENNLAQFAYIFIPAKNKGKNIITTVFKIGNPV